MTENVERWWARRQRSKGTDIPYAVGTYLTDWQRYPVLIRQYHPELNSGIVLSQVPPGADVYLLWECEVGHHFIATPDEQRNRPGLERRRSVWCPFCAEQAAPHPLRPYDAVTPAGDAPASPAHPPYACGHPFDELRIEDDPDDPRCYLCRRLDATGWSREKLVTMVIPSQRGSLSNENRSSAKYSWQCPRGHGSFPARITKILSGARCPVCRHAEAAADRYSPGDAFLSPHAPKPASAVEADLRQRIAGRLDVDVTLNAVKVRTPFFGHIEVWPDIVIPELKVAIEFDSTGRHGLEHVGRREATDQRKDRLLRAVGWEVIRVRTGRLQPLGPHDVLASGVTDRVVERVIDELESIRGPLFVAAYLR